MNDNDLENCAIEVALYALGALPAERAHAVEQRLRSGCRFCLAQAEHYTALADQLAQSVPRVGPPPQLRERLLDRIKESEEPREPPEYRRIVRANESPWVKLPFPGVEIRRLISNKTVMVRMEPGAVLPPHDHPHSEQCYVIEGSITDSDGVTVQAGDFVVMSSGIRHGPLHSETGCTFVVAYAD